MGVINSPTAAIVDYGMGNLYSVQRACDYVGLTSAITAVPDDVVAADGVILPGVGAMPDAMRALDRSGMSDALVAFCRSGKPLFAVCLGLQLLMSEGSEFGRHDGLGIVPGSVVRFDSRSGGERPLKVPQVGWNSIRMRLGPADRGTSAWRDTPLEGIDDGAHMYFVHSYYVVPHDPSISIAVSRYGDTEFCSGLARGNVFGWQFHPERSGPAGLTLYRNFRQLLSRRQDTHSQ